jgi:hypothetical protein
VLPIRIQDTSVADPGCLSRIPDPDFYPSRIPDLGSRIQKQQQKRKVKKISCHIFLGSHKFHKIVNYVSFEVLKTKMWANFQRIIELFTKKIVKKLLKIWVWDPGSGKNLFRTQGSKRHRIPDPDPQHCRIQCFIDLQKKCGSRQISVADLDPGSGAFLTPGSGMVFSGSWIPDLVSWIPNQYF